MAMSKIERIEKEIQKTREKITEYQNKLRGLEAQKTEAENLEIVQLVRAMRLTPQELTAMLSGNGIPGIAPMPTDYDEQEDNADEEENPCKPYRTLRRPCPCGRLFCYCLRADPDGGNRRQRRYL